MLVCIVAFGCIWNLGMVLIICLQDTSNEFQTVVISLRIEEIELGSSEIKPVRLEASK